jgi:hypothetical protein
LPAGVLGILNDLNPAGKPGEDVSSAVLEDAKKGLDLAAFQLLVEEIGYDEKCLAAYKANMQSFELRLQHLRDQWTKKRIDRSREAITQWWNAKVWMGCLVWQVVLN